MVTSQWTTPLDFLTGLGTDSMLVADIAQMICKHVDVLSSSLFSLDADAEQVALPARLLTPNKTLPTTPPFLFPNHHLLLNPTTRYTSLEPQHQI
jgi:hypothetical protein